MYDRFAKARVATALQDTRVVLIAGPRQSGKTTLATDFADDARPYYTLDDATTRAAVQADPNGFLRSLQSAVIDEVQRAPDLLLAIKAEVDRDPRPGRFLLTGSANIMTLPKVADSLAGRMEVIPLLPLAQAELVGVPPSFLDNAFAGAVPQVQNPILGADLIDAVLAGGYPEAIARKSLDRRLDWYDAYVDAIVQRDVRDVAQIEKLADMPKLLAVMAEHAGQLVNYSGMGGALGLNHVTTRKYLGIFESLFLVQTVPPWFTNKLSRLTKSPKLHFLDAGLLAALQGITPATLARDKTPFGAVLESFVFGEVRKIVGWSGQRYRMSHFRDKDGNEVDIVLENRQGEIVGIEVKASATVSGADFSGMRKLASACGDNFIQGLVLYDDDRVVPFQRHMSAVPISCLWSR